MKEEIVDVDEINEIIVSYANGDFSKRLSISDDRDARDSIIVGINMLGEELEQTTISKNYFSNIYNAVSDMLFVTDKNETIIDVNDTTIERMCSNKEMLVGMNFRSYIKPEKNSLVENLTNGEEKYIFETIMLSATGKFINVNCTTSRILNNNDEFQGYLIIAKDITAEKDQAKELISAIISTEEKERKRLAYDIHDSLGQELNAIQMYLSSLSHQDANGIQYKKTIEECKLMLNQSISTSRNLSFDLMPKSLEEGSFLFALTELVKRLGELCDINLKIPTDIKLKQESKVIIYRITQEFINNSLKHALPCIVNIEVVENENYCHFILQDNGAGFEMETTTKGRGIHSVKTRLKALNAEYNYVSKPDSGTKLEFRIIYENN
jgi:PAS domain S-box-containing protein